MNITNTYVYAGAKVVLRDLICSMVMLVSFFTFTTRSHVYDKKKLKKDALKLCSTFQFLSTAKEQGKTAKCPTFHQCFLKYSEPGLALLDQPIKLERSI